MAATWSLLGGTLLLVSGVVIPVGDHEEAR